MTRIKDIGDGYRQAQSNLDRENTKWSIARELRKPIFRFASLGDLILEAWGIFGIGILIGICIGVAIN